MLLKFRITSYDSIGHEDRNAAKETVIVFMSMPTRQNVDNGTIKETFTYHVITKCEKASLVVFRSIIEPSIPFAWKRSQS